MHCSVVVGNLTRLHRLLDFFVVGAGKLSLGTKRYVIMKGKNTPHASQRSAPRGVTLFERVKYNKPHQNLQEQLTLLIQRGLIVTDRQMAEHYLGHLNYYRLSAY